MQFLRRVVALITVCLLAVMMLVSCNSTKNESKEGETMYQNISAKDAKAIMEQEKDYVILDVRTEEEYEGGHIPNSVLLPDYEIADLAEEELTDKDQLILVYCRSGHRSKNAAKELISMGYTNVKDFGGIMDWPYDIER